MVVVGMVVVVAVAAALLPQVLAFPLGPAEQSSMRFMLHIIQLTNLRIRLRPASVEVATSRGGDGGGYEGYGSQDHLIFFSSSMSMSFS